MRTLAFTAVAVLALVAVSGTCFDVARAAPLPGSPLAAGFRTFDAVVMNLIGLEDRIVSVCQAYARGIFVPLASISLLVVIIQAVFKGGDFGELTSQVFWMSCFALLIEVGPGLGHDLVAGFREIGQSVSSSPVTPQALLDKTIKLASDGFAKGWYLPGSAVMTSVLGLVSMIIAALIAGVIFFWEAEARVVFAVATVLLGLGGASQTRSYATNYLRYGIGAGLRLLVVELINAQTMSVLDSGIEMTLREETSVMEVWLTLLGGYLITLLLLLAAPIAISSVASGSISSGANLIARAIPAAVGMSGLGALKAGLESFRGAGDQQGMRKGSGQESAGEMPERSAKHPDDGGPIPALRQLATAAVTSAVGGPTAAVTSAVGGQTAGMAAGGGATAGRSMSSMTGGGSTAMGNAAHGATIGTGGMPSIAPRQEGRQRTPNDQPMRLSGRGKNAQASDTPARASSEPASTVTLPKLSEGGKAIVSDDSIGVAVARDGVSERSVDDTTTGYVEDAISMPEESPVSTGRPAAEVGSRAPRSGTAPADAAEGSSAPNAGGESALEILPSGNGDGRFGGGIQVTAGQARDVPPKSSFRHSSSSASDVVDLGSVHADRSDEGNLRQSSDGVEHEGRGEARLTRNSARPPEQMPSIRARKGTAELEGASAEGTERGYRNRREDR